MLPLSTVQTFNANPPSRVTPGLLPDFYSRKFNSTSSLICTTTHPSILRNFNRLENIITWLQAVKYSLNTVRAVVTYAVHILLLICTGMYYGVKRNYFYYLRVEYRDTPESPGQEKTIVNKLPHINLLWQFLAGGRGRGKTMKKLRSSMMERIRGIFSLNEVNFSTKVTIIEKWISKPQLYILYELGITRCITIWGQHSSVVRVASQ